MANPESLFVAAADGGRLHVRRVGSGDLPCVFIHGFADGAYVWDSFVRSALTTQGMLSIDLRGHGDSTWSANGSYSIDQLIEDVVQVVDQLCLQKFVLVGHSLGGSIALRLCARQPERVAGLVVVDTAPAPSALARSVLLRELNDSLDRYQSIEEYARRLSSRRPLVSPKMIRHIADNALRPLENRSFEFKADARLGGLISGDDDTALWPIMRRIACPALIVRGALSGVLSQPVAEQMVRELQTARLQVVPKAGHSVMLDNPNGFRDAVAPFIKSFAALGQERS